MIPTLRFLSIIGTVSMVPVGASAASTIHVPADHPTIFQAIQFAQDGDTILVSPGTYPEQVDFQGKDIVIRSMNGPEVTILDGQDQYTVVMFVSDEPPSSRLEGFTVQNGRGVQSPEAGGIWCDESNPTIVDCIVRFNRGSDSTPSDISRGGAGGIGATAASPTIDGCLVESNVGGNVGSGTGGAGGIGFERAGIAGPGTGVVIRDCAVGFNQGGHVIGNGHAGTGGIYCGWAVARIEDSTIERNSGGDLLTTATSTKAGVGGVWSRSSAMQLARCRILSNNGGQAPANDSNDGGHGGLYFIDTLPTAPTMPQSMVNCVVAWNEGGYGLNDGGIGGARIKRAWIDITNCAVVGNVAGLADAVGGMEFESQSTVFPVASMTNVVFWQNEGQGGEADDLHAKQGADPITSNLLMGVDPQFVDPANDDFHLRCYSPAVDAGTDTSPVLPTTDIDGEPRLSGLQVDIGPDEVQDPGVFPTYCPSNPNSSGHPAAISATGCPSITQNELQVMLDDLPGTPGLLFYGPSQIQVTFGDGFRCVGGAIKRLPPMPGMGTSISIDLNLSTLQVAPGVTSNFQYWFRDPMAGGAGFNLSNGVSIGFTP